MVQQVPTRSVQESIHSNSTSLNSIQQATFHPSFHPSFHQTFRKFPVLRMELHTLELPGLQDRRFAIFWWLRCTNECYENYETQAQPNARTTQNYTDIIDYNRKYMSLWIEIRKGPLWSLCQDWLTSGLTFFLLSAANFKTTKPVAPARDKGLEDSEHLLEAPLDPNMCKDGCRTTKPFRLTNWHDSN